MGKRQNNQSMVVAEHTKMDTNTTMSSRAYEFFMPSPPKLSTESHFFANKIVIADVTHLSIGNPPKTAVRVCLEVVIDRDRRTLQNSAAPELGGDRTVDQPSMVSRRQWRAVRVNKTAVTARHDSVATTTSSTCTGSAFNTLVISRCWLSEGISIRELRVFSE